MQHGWVLYFFLTAATSLSFPEFITLLKSGLFRSHTTLLQLLAGCVVASAIALGFRENGLLASLMLFVYGYSVSPLLRFRDDLRVMPVFASVLCLMVAVGLLLSGPADMTSWFKRFEPSF